MTGTSDTGPTRTLELTTPDGAMPLYEAQPVGSAAERGMIVIQEAFGVNEHIEDVTRRFAAVGYHAVAPHVFHRTGGGTIPYDRFDLVGPHFAGMSDEGLLTDLDATISHLERAGLAPERAGIVGFCMGGRVSFLAAGSRRLGATVGFYGGGIVHGRSEKMPALLDLVPAMRTPFLGLFGDEDPSIPVEDVEELRRRLAEAPVDCEIVRYEAAGHGFFSDPRDSYHEESANDAWQRTLDWFDRFLA